MRHWFVSEVVFVCGLALLVGGGYWQGREAGRWQPLTEVQVLDFTEIPREFDGWTSTEYTLSDFVLSVGGIDGYLARNYQHVQTGEVVSVLIVSGAGGPISVHPPEVCFAGQGYRMEVAPIPFNVANESENQENDFHLAVFRGSGTTDGHCLQLVWGWTSSGNWSAPANPRLAFARERRLYKMYVSRAVHPNHDRDDADLSREIIQLLVPEISRGISRKAPAGAASTVRESADLGESSLRAATCV